MQNCNILLPYKYKNIRKKKKETKEKVLQNE